MRWSLKRRSPHAEDANSEVRTDLEETRKSEPVVETVKDPVEGSDTQSEADKTDALTSSDDFSAVHGVSSATNSDGAASLEETVEVSDILDDLKDSETGSSNETQTLEEATNALDETTIGAETSGEDAADVGDSTEDGTVLEEEAGAATSEDRTVDAETEVEIEKDKTPSAAGKRSMKKSILRFLKRRKPKLSRQDASSAAEVTHEAHETNLEEAPESEQETPESEQKTTVSEETDLAQSSNGEDEADKDTVGADVSHGEVAEAYNNLSRNSNGEDEADKETLGGDVSHGEVAEEYGNLSQQSSTVGPLSLLLSLPDDASLSLPETVSKTVSTDSTNNLAKKDDTTNSAKSCDDTVISLLTMRTLQEAYGKEEDMQSTSGKSTTRCTEVADLVAVDKYESLGVVNEQDDAREETEQRTQHYNDKYRSLSDTDSEEDVLLATANQGKALSDDKTKDDRLLQSAIQNKQLSDSEVRVKRELSPPRVNFLEDTETIRAKDDDCEIFSVRSFRTYDTCDSAADDENCFQGMASDLYAMHAEFFEEVCSLNCWRERDAESDDQDSVLS